MRPELPTGTVTFLFTDVEGSTRLLHELGPARYAEALGAHRRILREAVSAHGGVEVDTQGDAFFIAFPTPAGAGAAAQVALERLAEGSIRVRMGLHTGAKAMIRTSPASSVRLAPIRLATTLETSIEIPVKAK